MYRYKRCARTYNLYSGTVSQQRHLTRQQVALLGRGGLKGATGYGFSGWVGDRYITVLGLRRALQQQVQQMQSATPFPDEQAKDASHSYTHLLRPHATVAHGNKAWAHNDKGNDI